MNRNQQDNHPGRRPVPVSARPSPVTRAGVGLLGLFATWTSACGDLESLDDRGADSTRVAEQALAEDGPISEEMEEAMVAAARREAALRSTIRSFDAEDRTATEQRPSSFDGSGVGCTSDLQSVADADIPLRPSVRETDRYHRRDETIAALLLPTTDDDDERQAHLEDIRGALEDMDARLAEYPPGEHPPSADRLVERPAADAEGELELARRKLERSVAQMNEAQ
jgi:hypothetical protein